jgi:primosomal protein N' (replication factor Y)
LTHHREGEKALCHYCSFETITPANCPECKFDGIRFSGLGTQRLEAEVRGRFQGVPCLRMDSDSMQKPGSHEEALGKFRAGDVKILLGTQMIAKGLDIPNVTLVGVINADTALHFPDFRAAERTFQLVTQVAGRTGRGEKGGRVLVQTFSPEHPAIQAAVRHDYEGFARQELPVREEYGYPPYSNVARLIIRGPSLSHVGHFADHFAGQLLKEASSRGNDIQVLGPAPAPISKIKGNHRFHILLKCSQHNALSDFVRTVSGNLPRPDDVQWVADIDPVSLL